MTFISDVFQDRSKEIDEYIEFLKRIASREKGYREIIETSQYHMLLANLFLLMYNMIEAVMTTIKKYIAEEIYRYSDKVQSNQKKFHECLSEAIRQQWIASFVNVNESSDLSKRIKQYDKFYKCIIDNKFHPFELKQNNSGNWDDHNIQNFAKQIGVSLEIHSDLKKKIERLNFGEINISNKSGAIKYIKEKRNSLAHGNQSFQECGKELDLKTMIEIYLILKEYLKIVIVAFEKFIEQRDFWEE